MDRTDSRPKEPGVGIGYGFLEGPAHSSRFRKLLKQAGFSITSANKADIIIAHSAGCWLLPQDARPKIVIYVGMPLTMARPKRAWLRANLASFKNTPFRRNLTIRLNNTYYGLRQPRRNLDIFRNPKFARPVTFDQAQSVFIANRHDPWPATQAIDGFIAANRWAFISFPGAHDHIWEQPDQYVAIINHYARLLA